MLLVALALGDLAGVEIRHVRAHDGVDVGAQVLAAPADHLDGVGHRETSAVPRRRRRCPSPWRPRELALVCLVGSYSRRHTGPGLPLPTGLPSSDVTGCISRVAAPSRISSAERNSASLTPTERHFTPALSAISSITPRVVPGSSFQELGGVRSSPSMTTCTLEALASVSWPSRSRMHSEASSSTASWRSSTLASNDTDLMSQRDQRVSAP